jgi:hypothetical protein
VRGCRWVGEGACGGAGVEVRRWSGIGGARRGAGVELLRWQGCQGCQRPGGRCLLGTAGYVHDSDGGQVRRRQVR